MVNPSQHTPSPLISDASYDGEFDFISGSFCDNASSYPPPISVLDNYPPHQVSVQDLASFPTPPPSATSAPEPAEQSSAPDETISISTVFNPYAYSAESDLLFVTSDRVLFYVHSRVLKHTPNAPTAFHKFLGKSSTSDTQCLTQVTAEQSAPEPMDNLIAIPDDSSILNIILHLLYGTSPAQHSPSLETLATAIDRMPFYDINPKDRIVPHTPFYDLLLSLAPLSPLQLYTLAAHHDLYELTVATSSHLLYYPLTELPEEMAERMGARYLHRLLNLHLTRFNTLKQILLSPPKLHVPTKHCDFEEQKRLTRAWALVSAYLAWDARADLSTHSLQSAFQPLTKDILCDLCVAGLEARLKDAVIQWASVKRTI
ncbi:hypothetical protein D9756_001056 [Leucocoprinus leucothites]|uniref:BTB domain-containing protein n=1 Tax=Leucocoprinus leucothites TaxID=201217 RepID=A0A8H5LN86_9AGAR|nr:hypothetical protein D9756_001056 [Leucoagaricus leucothites]